MRVSGKAVQAVVAPPGVALIALQYFLSDTFRPTFSCGMQPWLVAWL